MFYVIYFFNNFFYYYYTSFPCRYRPVGAGNAYTPARAGFVVDAWTPANETADLVSLNMAAPVRSVSDMRDNPKTLNRSCVYIYNLLFLLFIIVTYVGKELLTE